MQCETIQDIHRVLRITMDSKGFSICVFLFTKKKQFFFYIQEGPANISVHGKASRTTNALEAYNGVLGRKIDKKGHFFKFMEEIQDQEFRKRSDFANLVRVAANQEPGNVFE